MRTTLLNRFAKPSSLFLIVLFILCTKPVAATELWPGVVIDPASNNVFIAMPEGGIQAIDVPTGKILWTSKNADMPVVAHNGQLIARVEDALPGKLSLICFSVSDGIVLNSIHISLPKDVHALIDKRLGEHFKIRADVEETSIFLTWRYSHQVVSGPKPEREEVPRIETGTFAFNLETGELLDVRVAREWPAAAIELGVEQRLPGVSGRQFRSAHGAFVLASERQSGAADKEYIWTLLSDKGEKIGSFPSALSYASYHVSGTVVAFVTHPSTEITPAGGGVLHPLSLLAVNIVDGSELWMMPLRDTSYSGPVPR